MRNGVAAPLVTVICTGSALAQTGAPARTVGTYKLVSSEQTGYLAWEARCRRRPRLTLFSLPR